jgi:hypothetical protein
MSSRSGHTALPSAARRKQAKMAARESPSARRKQSNPAANASSAVNEEEKSEDIPVDPLTVAQAVVVDKEVGTENEKLKIMERERIENGEEKEILRRQMEDAMIHTQEKKRRNKRRMYIFIFVVVVIIAGVGAYLVRSLQKYLAILENTIMYAGGYDTIDDDYGIQRKINDVVVINDTRKQQSTTTNFSLLLVLAISLV